MQSRQELIDATDEIIDDAVKYADPMALRGLIYQLTGDESIANIEVTTTVVGFTETQKVAKLSDVALLQSKGAEFLKSYRSQGAGEISIGPAERLNRSLSLANGIDIPPSEFEFWRESLALDPWVRGLVWQEQPSAQDLEKFSVMVVGAGMGGLNAAVQLKHAGIPYVVLEKNTGVGGTWFENRYPGCRVDTMSRAYTHTYGVEFEIPNPYCEQSVNEKYFNWVADHFDIRKDIQFETEVISMIWDEAAKIWEITAVGPAGRRVYRANAVISSVGLLIRPSIPKIDGADEFAGRSFHTARWPANLDLKGKKVAVIGTGCTGYQLVPELVKESSHTYVFQRTPSWCFEVPGYLSPYPPQVNWLDRNFPYYTNFMRFRASRVYAPELVRRVWLIDPDFKDPHARSAINKTMRDQRLKFMREKFANRPDLFAKMLPDAPPMSSRPVRIDPTYSIYDVLLQDDVTLVTDGIKKLEPEGIECQDGSKYPADVIVYATGFKANEFLWPMEIRGRHGKRPEELWEKDGARAYLGTMLPGFPNLFMLYGPNSNPTGGLAVADFEEMVTRFALECIQELIVQKKRTVEPTLDAYWRFNDELDRWEPHMMYMDPRVNTYFKNEHGRSSTNSAIDTRLMWGWLRSPLSRPPGGRHPIVDATVGHDPGIRPYFGEDLTVE
jgi:4-hydroxyacetophenone monooxygenase